MLKAIFMDQMRMTVNLTVKTLMAAYDSLKINILECLLMIEWE